MASSLEIAKLVVASLLYTYWGELNRLLRLYLTIACIALMLITSGGIYGFLSGAYQETAIKSELLDRHTLVLQTKQSRFIEQLGNEKELVLYYTEALSNPTMIQYVDSASKQLVTTTSSRQRRLMTDQLSEVKNKVDVLGDSISIYDMKILNKQVSNEGARELGPLKYVAKSLGIEMDKVVNYFLLLIVLVFDPLAIALVVSANFAFSRNIDPGETYRSFGSWINVFSKRHYIKKRV
jgi:hypothetical protein